MAENNLILCEFHGKQEMDIFNNCPLCESIEVPALPHQPACFYCCGDGCEKCEDQGVYN